MSSWFKRQSSRHLVARNCTELNRDILPSLTYTRRHHVSTSWVSLCGSESEPGGTTTAGRDPTPAGGRVGSRRTRPGPPIATRGGAEQTTPTRDGTRTRSATGGGGRISQFRS